MIYKLDKKIWTESDFEKMGWHDNSIYRIRLTEDLEMDIDYIFKWNQPEVQGLPFTFWIAPSTLVFKRIKNLTFDFDIMVEFGFEIDDITRENKDQWIISTQQGDIQFTSNGFEQFIRQEPSFQFSQAISYKERNGYSIERITNQLNPNLLREDIIEEREKDFELYEMAKKRAIKKHELEQIILFRDNGELNTKEYLLKKKEINELLFSYDSFLQGTKFKDW